MDELRQLAAGIALVIFDVDGVFTDGRLFFGPEGETHKVFHVRDGYGVKSLARAGIQQLSDALARR